MGRYTFRMSRWGKWIGWFVLGVALLAAIAIPAVVGIRPIIGPRSRPVTERTFEATEARWARGEYLVTAVAGCLNCHSELDWNAPGFPVKPGTAGGGRSWASEGLPWITAPNITPDRGVGIGALSDDAVARAIREGIRHDGRALFPIMPYQHYKYLSDEDLASIIVYVRTLPPVSNQLPPTEIPFPLSRLINSVPEPVIAPVPAPDRGNPTAYGEYLVRVGVCRDCHTPRDAQGASLMDLDLGGGNTLTGPYGAVAAVNITPAPSGIPYYTEELFLTMMRTGMVKARKLHDQMPWSVYGKQTDEDLKAMFAYLQTVKPVAHRVDNTLPATPCAVCGLSHGAGDQNSDRN
jgi:mono/diheme cytochrome c family protein